MEFVEILIQRGDGSSEPRSLANGVYEIGRESGDIALGDPNVSNGHALLRVHNGEASVTDNHSTNGTFDFSGRRLSGTLVLSASNGVRLGNSSIQVAPKLPEGRGGTQVMQAMPDAAVSGLAPAASAAATIKRRATILKAPGESPGLLLVDGRQLGFSLEGVWRVPAAPTAGMAVEVELDASGALLSVYAADPTALMREHGQKAVSLAQSGFALAVERMGKGPFVTAVVLVFGWFSLSAVSFGGLLSFTFWDLSSANLGSSFELLAGRSVGILGLLGLLAVLAPFGQLRVPNLRLLNAAPAAFLGLWFLRQLVGLGSAAWEAQRQKENSRRALDRLIGDRAQADAAPAEDSLFDSLGDWMTQLIWDQLSFGLGIWVVFGASAILLAHVFTRPKSV